MTEKSKFPILVGPTGVGKSEVALQLASKLNAEILSADAFQVYKGLAVGTAQPSTDWQKKVKHHLVGVLEPGEPWNSVLFAQRASDILADGVSQGKRFLLVGGAGFYLRALVEGAPSGSASDPETREKVAAMGIEDAKAWLETHDPAAAKRLHSNDAMRIRRAVEKTLTSTKETPTFKPLGRENVIFLGLERSRSYLDTMLLARTDWMWKNGILNETKSLLERGLPNEHPVWGAIGYFEAAAFFRKEMTEKEARERIFRRTRQYAKRQWTWFRHQHDVQWINLDRFEGTDAIVEDLMSRLQSKA